MRGSLGLRVAVVLLAVTVAGTAGFLSRDDWNWARPLVSWLVERETGRTLDLVGNLRVDLGRRTEVSAEGVWFGNSVWAEAPSMLEAGRVAFRVPWPALLRGALEIDRLEVRDARLHLERRPQGWRNWSFAGGTVPRLPAELLLERCDVLLLDPHWPQSFALQVEHLEVSEVGGLNRLQGVGSYQRQPFEVEATLDGWPEQGGPSVSLVARAIAGSTLVMAQGTIGDGVSVDRFDVDLQAFGESLDDVWRLTGLPLPRSPAFVLAGHLSHRTGVVRLRQFAGRLGHSDVGGDLVVRGAPGARMSIEAELHSPAVDLEDFAGFWGRPPGAEVADDSAPLGTVSAFSDAQFDLAKLRFADARIHFQADRVLGESVIEDVELSAILDRGLLRLEPLAMGLATGQLVARGTFDARGPETTRVQGEVSMQGGDLTGLLARGGLRGAAGGKAGERAQFESHGDSLRALAANADGEMGSLLEGGSTR